METLKSRQMPVEFDYQEINNDTININADSKDDELQKTLKPIFILLIAPVSQGAAIY